MASCDSIGWSFIEEAVIRDRGYDEEAVLASILQSYFIRCGFVDSLTALNEELCELDSTEGSVEVNLNSNIMDAKGKKPKKCGVDPQNGNGICNATSTLPIGRAVNGRVPSVDDSSDPFVTVLDAMAKRKRAQTLCLREEYEEAAALLPEESVYRVKLLAMEALKRAKTNPPTALTFLCERVGPLVAASSDAVAAHHVYVDSLAAITGASPPGWSLPPPCAIAHEVNESLLHDHGPNALDVLISWSDWQSSVWPKRHKVKFPFMTNTGMKKA